MPEQQRVFIRDFAGGFQGTIVEFKKEFRRRLQLKISSHVDQIGRKFDFDYQRTMYFDARAINRYHRDRIIERRSITTDFLRKRYGWGYLLEIE